MHGCVLENINFETDIILTKPVDVFPLPIPGINGLLSCAAAAAMDTEEAVEEEEELDEDLKAALAMSIEPEQQPPVGPGLPSDFRGLYELFAVVTHKGRDADGGHYMGWVKADNADTRKQTKREKIADTDEDNDDWFVFDDDEVSPCKTEDIIKLKGGGDWHMSYLNFYRAKK